MANAPIKFTKKDFLNAAALVKKLNAEYGTEYDIDTVQNALEKEYRKKTPLKTQYCCVTDLVYDAKWIGKKSLRLHPLGLEKFKEILDKGK